MTRQITILFGLINIFPLLLYSQENVRTLSLDQAIELACDSSLTSFRNKNMYLSYYWEYRSYKANRLPALSLQLTPASYHRYMTQRYDWDNNIDVFRPQKTYEAYLGLNLSQNFDPLGGKFYLETSLDYLRNFGITHASQYSSVPIRVGYSQSLVGFNSLKWEKKIEPIKFEKAQKELIYNMELVSENIVSAFFGLALAQANYDLAVTNKATADTLYVVGERRYGIASISNTDLLTLKLDKLNATNDLEICSIALQKAKQTFNILIGQPPNSDIRIIIPDNLPNHAVSVDIALEEALENNPEFIDHKQKIVEAQRDVNKAKVEAILNASLDVSVGFNQISNKFIDVYNNPMRSDLVSISLSIPLLDWGMRKGRLNMAKNNLNVTQITADQQKQLIEESVIMTIRNISVQRELVLSAQEAREIAQHTFTLTKQNFILGKADLNSLTLAQNRQQSANTNYIIAMQNFWASYYQLRRLTLYDFEHDISLIESFNFRYGL